MPYLQHFFIEGRHLGTSERGKIFCHGDLQAPTSVAFFCPKCAEVWAKAMVEGGDYCEVRSVLCRKHPSLTFAISGSLFSSWDMELVNAFPAEVIAWEFQQHLNYFEGTNK